MQSNGNEEYFTEVYKRYRGYVRTIFLRNYPFCQPVIDDLTQEVFIAFWRYLNKKPFDEGIRYEPILSTISHHKVTDFLRKTKGQRKYTSKGKPKKTKERPKIINLDENELRLISSEGSNPLELTLLEERENNLSKLVQDCLGYIESRIKFKKAQCLKLYVNGNSTDEIAEKFGSSRSLIDTHISLMRKKLRKKFAKELQELYED